MPSPEQIEAMLAERERDARAHADLHIAQRRETLFWAAVLCSCRPWFRRGEPDGLADCPVHNSFVMMPDGSLL
jgi:hypothetical protein